MRRINLEAKYIQGKGKAMQQLFTQHFRTVKEIITACEETGEAASVTMIATSEEGSLDINITVACEDPLLKQLLDEKLDACRGIFY